MRVLTVARAASTLEEELEREFELVLRAVRVASTLEDEFTVARAASTLDEELERLRLEV